MVKKRNSGSENIETVPTSSGRRQQSNLMPAGRPQTNDLADLNEQLRTEVEELRRQVAELHELKDEDQRAIRDWEWLARLADENPDPVLRVSQYGVILYRNPASVSLCRQWNPDDELAVPQAVRKLVSAAYAGAEVIHREVVFGERTYLVAVAPAPSPAKYTNIYVRDITEPKQAEQLLRESEQRLRRAEEIAHLGSWELDLTTNKLTWSDEVYRIFGLQPQQFGATYKAFLEAVHPEDQAAVDAAYSGSLREGRDSYEIEHRVVQKFSGDVRIVHEKCQHVRDDSGKIVRSMGMVRDITEHKQAEEALRAAHEYAAWLARFPEENPNPVLRVSDEGTILYHNRAAAELSGWACKLGHSPAEPLVRLVRRAMTEGREVREDIELGKTIYLVWAVPSPSEHYANVYARDITDRKQAEQALRELTATLESRVTQRTAELRHRARQLQKLTLDMSEAEDRERKRMAEILHDDLQQVLAAAKFQVSLMRSRAKYDAALQATAAETDHMLKDAIEKSRSLSHDLSPTVMHHGDFAETLRWLAGQVQARHGLVVRVQTAGDVHLQSEALKGLLYRAAQELLFNVVKHARVREAGIRVRRYRQWVCLVVSDRGRGFAPQELRETAGFGLLSIQERIELLGGRMKIKSAKGTGSTFLIVVPYGELVAPGAKTTARASGPVQAAEPVAEEANGRLRILLADDHEIVREGLRSLLRDEHDVEVVGEAANGREAVDLASQLQPDVIIMDVSMPLIGGDEASRQIKTYLPRTRVIALSMYDQAEKIDAMYRAGAESYVLKTAPSDELLAAIRGPSTVGS